MANEKPNNLLLLRKQNALSDLKETHSEERERVVRNTTFLYKVTFTMAYYV